MVQLGTRRTALVLYGVLLVLPTLVLGGLHWRQLAIDHESQLEAVPRGVADAARRLSDALKEDVDALLASERRRFFCEYKSLYYPANPVLGSIGFYTSPLSKDARPAGILGWFQFQTNDRSQSGPEIQIGAEEDSTLARDTRAELLGATKDLARLLVSQTRLPRLRPVPASQVLSYSVPVIAINLSSEEDLTCLRDAGQELRGLEKIETKARVYDFELRLFRDARGAPRLVAYRSVKVEEMPALATMPLCFETAKNGPEFIQGFFIDGDWLFHMLPQQLAARTLIPNQEFFGPDQTGGLPDKFESQSVRPVRVLGIEADDRELGFGTMSVAVDTELLRERFRSQMLHLAGVGAMLILSLATGLALLLRSVSHDLESARRTENFVSAVTHELRTPLSAIRLYAEMLQDGWVHDDAKRSLYYQRIVREAQRLETLVERVLEKGRLTSKETQVEPGDLNRVVDGLRASLIGPDESPARDLVFELEAELPPVYLYPEGIRSIVGNLVENARKYAAVPEGGEPIRVVTRRAGKEVVLEVHDRGPGIPESERERVFEAFYRVGNETTRTAKGTGLGLHLVALQADAMGGRVEVLSRPGGGTIFRVHLVAADDADR